MLLSSSGFYASPQARQRLSNITTPSIRYELLIKSVPQFWACRGDTLPLKRTRSMAFIVPFVYYPLTFYRFLMNVVLFRTWPHHLIWKTLCQVFSASLLAITHLGRYALIFNTLLCCLRLAGRLNRNQPINDTTKLLKNV